MASKQYKKVYTIYKGYGNPTIQVHLVRETKKTYIDITAEVVRAHKEKGTIPWIGYLRYMGRLLKENEYLLFSNDYSIYMFGSDLEKLKQAWEAATTPVNEEGFEDNSVVVDVMVTKLNNREETETGELEDD